MKSQEIWCYVLGYTFLQKRLKVVWRKRRLSYCGVEFVMWDEFFKGQDRKYPLHHIKDTMRFKGFSLSPFSLREISLSPTFLRESSLSPLSLKEFSLSPLFLGEFSLSPFSLRELGFSSSLLEGFSLGFSLSPFSLIEFRLSHLSLRGFSLSQEQNEILNN